MTKCEQMLKDISVVDFVLVELALYLDTHNKDGKALEYYKHYCRIKNQMMMDFSRLYYPLTKEYADHEKEWTWGNAPLPWEGGCE